MKFASWPHHADFVQTPLPVVAMVTLVLGVQLFLMGLLGRNDGAHLSRVAGEIDLRGAREDRV